MKPKLILKRTFALLLTFAFLAACQVSAAAAKARTVPSARADWVLLEASSDDFNGTKLDEEKWNNGLWYDVSSDLAFKDDNVTVEDGNLVLSAKEESYNGKNYTIGAVESKFDVPGKASYVEVRAKVLDSNANVLSAIWMQSSPLTAENNPNPEIDIMESFNYNHVRSALHTWSNSKLLGQVHLQTGLHSWKTPCKDISQDYHTYGLERNDNKLRFYFDGQVIWETVSLVSNKDFVKMARHMVLSLEGHNGTPVAKYLPSAFYIDYVHTYIPA